MVTVHDWGGGLPQESHASLAIFRVAEIFEIFDFWLKNVGFLRQICDFSGKIANFSQKSHRKENRPFENLG